MKRLVDCIYMTKRTIKKYEIDNPNELVSIADASKGIITKNNQDIQNGANWVTSQRAVILLTDRNIICGKWKISLETISTAKLYRYGSGQVLKIQTSDGTNYQFGMQINPEWTNQEILPLTLENVKVKYSLFSIIVRLMAIGGLVFWLYKRFIAS